MMMMVVMMMVMMMVVTMTRNGGLKSFWAVVRTKVLTTTFF